MPVPLSMHTEGAHKQADQGDGHQQRRREHYLLEKQLLGLLTRQIQQCKQQQHLSSETRYVPNAHVPNVDKYRERL